MGIRVWVCAGVLACLSCTARIQENAADLLREADRLAWLTNWTAAGPLFARAERAAGESGDARAALYARFGRLRAEMQLRSLPDASAEIARLLDGELGQRDRWLRLRGLTVKGDIDLEWDVPAARATWQEVLELAMALQNDGWINRAKGELGMIAFLEGNSGQASAQVARSLQNAVQLGDVGGQLRYLSAIGAGLLLAGDPQTSLGYIEKALGVAKQHPETGFPYPAHSTKILALLAQQRPDDAQRLVDEALKQAAVDRSRIKEVELLMMAATIARARGRDDAALASLDRASQIATEGGVQRLLGEVEAERAATYRKRGDLVQALDSARVAVRATKAAGSRWQLPQQLQVQAATEVALGKIAEAEATFEEAHDVLEGTMLNVPSPAAQARLVGVMSQVYTGHFALAAQQGDARKAFAVLERARGRALADMLLDTGPATSAINPQHNRRISQLQVRLLRASTPAERRRILDDLWSAEQAVRPTVSGQAPRQITRRSDVEGVQGALGPEETLLAYVLSEPQSYCLVITTTDVRVVTLAPAPTINTAADAAVSEIRNGRGSTARDQLQALVAAPVLPHARGNRFVVVPDGQLHRVPFDRIIPSASGAAASVTVTPSATVFALLRQQSHDTDTPTSERKTLFAVGGVPYGLLQQTSALRSAPESRGLYDVQRPPILGTIPASRTEALMAAQLLKGANVVLTGKDANESVLKSQRLEDFDVLHFAVHAFADPEFPARAALVVLGDAAAGEDGLLQPREISSWKLNAKLVVLSACDTSVGPTIGQEGVQNLARAFLGAGARAVITTLWAVNDRLSLALMRSFYANIAAGQPVAAALGAAKVELSRQLGPPALPTIAAFQVVGDGDVRITAPDRQVAATDTRYEHEVAGRQ